MPDGCVYNDRSQNSVFNPPNVVTLARLCAVPLAFWLVLEQRLGEAFFLFVAAGISDAVDGWLARRYGGNAVGAILDPLADKMLLVTMYTTLAVIGVIPAWLAILVVFRDLLIVGGVITLAVLGYRLVIRPLYISKFNTVCQIILVAISLLLSGFQISIPFLLEGLYWIVAMTTFCSGAAYLWLTARR